METFILKDPYPLTASRGYQIDLHLGDESYGLQFADLKSSGGFYERLYFGAIGLEFYVDDPGRIRRIRTGSNFKVFVVDLVGWSQVSLPRNDLLASLAPVIDQARQPNPDLPSLAGPYVDWYHRWQSQRGIDHLQPLQMQLEDSLLDRVLDPVTNWPDPCTIQHLLSYVPFALLAELLEVSPKELHNYCDREAVILPN